MKTSTKITSIVIIFFLIIATVIIGRTMIGNHFKKKFSKRPPPGIIITTTKERVFENVVSTYGTAAPIQTQSFKIEKYEILKPIKFNQKVKKGDLIAQTDGLFGFFKSEVLSPVEGSIESISEVTGQIIMREAPIPVEIDAYMSGTVKNIIPNEGVTIQAHAAFIQGIFGIGGEARGDMEVLIEDRGSELTEDLLNESHEGKIVVGGGFISLKTFKKAMRLRVAGVVVGGKVPIVITSRSDEAPARMASIAAAVVALDQ